MSGGVYSGSERRGASLMILEANTDNTDKTDMLGRLRLKINQNLIQNLLRISEL